VNKRQVIEVLAAVLQNRKPLLPGHSVCLDCKRNGTTCVLVSQGLPCLGPVTRAGCGAICPANHRGCYGCFGPAPQVEVSTLLPVLEAVERRPGEIFQLLRNFSGYAPVFRQAAEKLAASQGEG
jgi:coenzyme F420-reducing hydrogenase gamma subunit